MSEQSSAHTMRKAPTGIVGFDEITGGGLPASQTSLICGGPGCGKTTLSMGFLVHGAEEHDEPGLFASFSETEEQLLRNYRSMLPSLPELLDDGRLELMHIDVSDGMVVESGSFSLDPLLLRLERRIRKAGARRLVVDGLETLMAAVAESPTLRAEVRRMFRWLGDLDVTTVLTAERGEGALTRYGFEEYLSDCVVLLDHRNVDQLSTRRLQVVKYRGSAHGTNEFPFVIGERGLSVFPISTVRLDAPAPEERVGSGIESLDALLVEGGYHRGSAVLVSGKAGTAKTSLCASFAAAASRRGEKVLYFAFEESPLQLARNMRSIGLDLDRWREEGLLRVRSMRPSFLGLEEHLFSVLGEVDCNEPDMVVIDPVTSFISQGTVAQVKGMLMRIFDELKNRQTTLIMSALISGGGRADETDVGVSSLADTWIALGLERVGGTRRRLLRIIKSRGTEHDTDVHELSLSSQGLRVVASSLEQRLAREGSSSGPME